MGASLAEKRSGSAPETQGETPPRFNELAAGRHNEASYDGYYRGMDATARQKVAWTTPHIQPSGATVADMGMGTGKTTNDLAHLYPDNTFFGIDVDPHSIHTARTRYERENLHFVQGDISTAVLPPRSVHALLFSSILHELPCYGPPEERFRFGVIDRVLDSAKQQLKQDGHIIIRDFVAPQGPEIVHLEIPATDGASEGPPSKLSSAALLREFARTFKSSRYPNGGLDKVVEDLGECAPGWQRFKLPLRDAAEFILRRHYTDRWAEELREEYLFWNQKDAESALEQRGFRVITAQEIHNPWIVENRFKGTFRITDLAGTNVPFPPTNFLVVGKNVPAGDGVGFNHSADTALAAPKYISVSAYKNTNPDSAEFGKLFEVISRPNQTVDLVPWFRSNGGLYVLAKSDYPRPLVNAGHPAGQLDRSTSSGYIAEPLNAVLTQENGNGLQFFDSTLKRMLHDRAAAQPVEAGGTSRWDYRYFTSPGALDELVLSKFVQIEPQRDLRFPHANYSNFATSGTVRPLEARQALRAYQIGGMFDSRLETNIYRLLLQEKMPWGPWIGADVRLTERSVPHIIRDSVRSIAAARSICYVERPATERGDFMELRAATFNERDASGNELAANTIEYAQPKNRSNDTISVLPIVKTANGILVGIEERDLPVPQRKLGSSRILTVPAFRLPKDISNLDQADAFAVRKIESDFGVKLAAPQPLGGKYFPSPGVLPETVYPRIAEVTAVAAENFPTKSKLRWVGLEDLVANHAEILDGHLLTSLFRAAHAVS